MNFSFRTEVESEAVASPELVMIVSPKSAMHARRSLLMRIFAFDTSKWNRNARQPDARTPFRSPWAT